MYKINTIQYVFYKLHKTMKLDLLVDRFVHEFHWSPGFPPQMVPPAIAKQLKSGHHVEPQYFSSATMCYIDVVDFMKLTGNIRAQHAATFISQLLRYPLPSDCSIAFLTVAFHGKYGYQFKIVNTLKKCKYSNKTIQDEWLTHLRPGRTVN